MGDTGKIIIAAIGMAIFVGIFANLDAKPGGSNLSPKERKEAAATECWREYERKSLDAGTKQFVAATCERLDAEARALPR